MSGVDMDVVRDIISQAMVENTDTDMAIAIAYQKIGERIIDDVVGDKTNPECLKILRKVMRARTLLGFFQVEGPEEQRYGGKLAENIVAVFNIWQELLLYTHENYSEISKKSGAKMISMAELVASHEGVVVETNTHFGTYSEQGFVSIKTARLNEAQWFFFDALIVLMGSEEMLEFSKRFSSACDLMKEYQARSGMPSNALGN